MSATLICRIQNTGKGKGPIILLKTGATGIPVAEPRPDGAEATRALRPMRNESKLQTPTPSTDAVSHGIIRGPDSEQSNQDGVDSLYEK